MLLTMLLLSLMSAVWFCFNGTKTYIKHAYSVSLAQFMCHPLKLAYKSSPVEPCALSGPQKSAIIPSHAAAVSHAMQQAKPVTAPMLQQPDDTIVQTSLQVHTYRSCSKLRQPSAVAIPRSLGESGMRRGRALCAKLPTCSMACVVAHPAATFFAFLVFRSAAGWRCIAVLRQAMQRRG